MNTEEINNKSETSTWQNKLLPLMMRMLVGLTIFFFIASFYQLYYLHSRIESIPEIDIEDVIATSESALQAGETTQLQILQWKTLATLDEHTLNQRYHQANVLLMARIWTRYLCFVTGMILCLVGASFILGKIELAETNLGGESQVANFSLKTSSPGIVLAVLGTILMVTAVTVHNDIKVTDGPAYLQLKFLSAISNTETRPAPLLQKPTNSTVADDTSTVSQEQRDKMLQERQKILERFKNRRKTN